MNKNKLTIPETLASESGFSIIEALVAISIFSIGFMALTAAILSSSNVTRKTVLSDWSVLAGQEVMEMLTVVDMNYNFLTDGNHQPVFSNANAEFGQIDMEWDIIDSQDPDSDGTDDFKTIAISVESDGELRMQSIYRRQIN